MYGELRKLAAAKLAEEQPGQTLQATALVHDAYLRLVDVDRAQRWDGRGHFFAAAAEAMRRILVETARRKQRLRHGGEFDKRNLRDVEITVDGPSYSILILDEALQRLAKAAPLKAELVKLRYFAGMSVSEAAEILKISTSTADRHWTYARAWLFREIAAEGEL